MAMSGAEACGGRWGKTGCGSGVRATGNLIFVKKVLRRCALFDFEPIWGIESLSIEDKGPDMSA